MARLTDRGFTEEEAAEFQERASGAHTLRWTADVYRWVEGEENTLYEGLPVVGGTLALDGSDPTRRRLTLDLGGGEALIPDKPYDPIAPFGQIIKLWVQIDRADGTWFPQLKMGEYPIQTTTVEWPSLTQTVEAADYSWLVDAYLFEKKKSYNHMTIREAVEDIVKDALPDREFFIQSPGDAHDIKVEPHTNSEAGTGRWEFAKTICQARGFECFFNHNGNLVIRHDVTNNSDDVETIPGEGPDIGTVSNPAAVIKEGPGGNLVALTLGLTREGAVNGVFINVHETIAQRVAERKVREAAAGAPGPPEKEPDPDYEPDWDDVLRGDEPPPPEPDDPDPEIPPKDDGESHDHDDVEVPTIPNPKAGDPRVNVQVKALGVGAVKWGDKFGRQNIVLERNVKRINDNVINAQIHRAKRLLHKRGGVIRSIDLDAVGLYWLEPDDKVRVKYAGRTEAHYVASIEFDLSGAEPARVRTRSLNVTDPGSTPTPTYTAFSTVGTHSFTPAAGVTSVDVLLVGGGGGGGGVGGSGSSGGGGGGGVFRIDDVAVTPGVAYTVEVGGGGVGGTGGAAGGHGDESFFNGGVETYYAGGGGGGGYHTGGNGGNGRSEGGSGGGGGSATSGTAGTGGAGDGAPVTGHDGGDGFVSSTSAGRNGGGGGGAGAAGGDADTGGGGGGGAGIDMSGYVGTSYGDSGWFGGGGGGGEHATGTAGGQGGGGSGGGWSGATAQPGAANTGGGGGGLGSFSGSDGSGRAGGSGCVVVRTVTGSG